MAGTSRAWWQPWNWGISARSAFVAATVVFLALTLAGAGLAAEVESDGVHRMEAQVLHTDERILAVQVIAADGTVVAQSDSAHRPDWRPTATPTRSSSRWRSPHRS